MLTLQSPHNNVNHSNLSSKIHVLSSNISPTFRNKRIPSAHDNYCYASNQNLKMTKIESPSKFSQGLKRRKSQYINSNSYVWKCQPLPHRKKSSKSINQNTSNTSLNLIPNPATIGKDPLTNNYPHDIINQMNCLKN